MRQPYYATLIAGDTSIRRPFFEYFNRSLEIATARVAATMGIPGVYWPETATLFGTYSSGGLGWGCNGRRIRSTPSASDFARDEWIHPLLYQRFA